MISRLLILACSNGSLFLLRRKVEAVGVGVGWRMTECVIKELSTASIAFCSNGRANRNGLVRIEGFRWLYYL